MSPFSGYIPLLQFDTNKGIIIIILSDFFEARGGCTQAKVLERHDIKFPGFRGLFSKFLT